MRNLDLLEIYRLEVPGFQSDAFGGAFEVTFPGGDTRSERGIVRLRVIASTGEGWDHVSVSTNRRCPWWDEMEYVKRLFFKDDETAMQLHVPPALHINCHPHCLHLWRPHDWQIILPSRDLIGPS